MNAGQFAKRFILDLRQQTNRQPRKEFRADVGNTRESAQQDQATRRLPQCQLRPNAAPEGFAVDDNVPRCKALLAEPGVSGLCVLIRTFLTGPALATAVT